MTKILPDLISPIARVTFQEVVGGARELLCAYTCALTITRMYQSFHCAKNSWKKNSPMACIGEIDENFLQVKFPRIRYYASNRE